MGRLTRTISSSYGFQTRVFCILSDERVYRSKSPEIFNRVMKRIGLNAMYVPFRVESDQIGAAMNSLRILNIAGANVTVPYKERVIAFMDVLSEGANIIGAVNTIVCKDGTLKGYNTNAIGVMDALADAGFDIADKTALVFGTGGAARAVVFILKWLRAQSVYIVGRDETAARRISEKVGGDVAPFSADWVHGIPAHIVINATSVSSPDEAPELAAIASTLNLSQCELLFDLNYGRQDNFWQAIAQEHRVPFMDGVSALAFQARRTFMLWTGLEVPPGEFQESL